MDQLVPIPLGHTASSVEEGDVLFNTRDLSYASSHRQDYTYHGICHTREQHVAPGKNICSWCDGYSDQSSIELFLLPASGP